MIEQQAVGANGLVAVVLDEERLAREARQEERSERGAGDMDDVGGANEAPELKQARAADDAKRERAVVVMAGGSLRHESEVELARAVRIAEVGESARQGLHNSFDAADAGGEEMGVEEQVQV